GPVGSVQPLPDGAVDDPLLQDRSEVGRQLGLSPGGLARAEALQAALQVGVEPALDTAGADGEVFRDGLMGAAALGQQDDLGAVPHAAVRGGPKGLLKNAELVRR